MVARDARALGMRRPEAIPFDTAHTVPWVACGVAAGVLGASCVAAFFLLLDTAAGNPFWTPYALASALLRGRIPSVLAAPDAPLVLAYTAIHFSLFVGFATPAAFWVLGRLPSARGRGRATLLAVVLFGALQAAFLTMAALFAPELVYTFTAGRMAIANALAAAAISAFLFGRVRHRRVHRHRPRDPRLARRGRR